MHNRRDKKHDSSLDLLPNNRQNVTEKMFDFTFMIKRFQANSAAHDLDRKTFRWKSESQAKYSFNHKQYETLGM